MLFRLILRQGHIANAANKMTRGNIKIADAVAAFRYDFRGKVVLDIGSSTGGFTEFALEHGAKKVIAVEKGARQMMAPLRFDPRVELHEKTDIFDVCTDDTSGVVIETPDVIVADVSFISLKPVIKHVSRHIAGKNTDFLMMLKPQFEAEEWQLNRGVVKNEKMRREIMRKFEDFLKQNRLLILGKHDNELPGKKGNVERFYYFKMT